MHASTNSWGDCYYDHYARFLGAPAHRSIYRRDPSKPTVQLLEYEKVFSGCRVLCSLGLSHYVDELGTVAEVCAAVNGEFELIPRLLANALFYMIDAKMQIGWGLAIGGIDRIAPQFYLQYRKVAWYLTRPVNLPGDFYKVTCQRDEGRVYMAFLLTDGEFEYFKTNGAEPLEDRLTLANIDPFELDRKSAV
jgi:hypothetical protein